MSVMATGLTPSTYDNLQTGAGVFLIDVDYSTAKDKAALAALMADAIQDKSKCLGATQGGGTLVMEPETRQIAPDGYRYAVVGSTVFDSWNIRMTGTMKEVTPENLQRVMACADVTKGEGTDKTTTVALRTQPKKTDYISHLIWVGDTSKGFMLADLSNALNTNGLNMTFADKNEGSLPFEFHAHKGMEDLLDNATAPVKLIFFE